MPQTPSRRNLVLLVDDHADIRLAMALGLEQAGYQVLQAGTAEEALRLTAASRPALVITDQRLPDRTGLELAALIRQQDADPSPELILFSGHTDRQLLQDAQTAGFTTCLTKPIEMDDLIQLLQSLDWQS